MEFSGGILSLKILIYLLLCMSASGSIFFLIYLLLNFFTHESFTASFRYTMLKLNILFFLFPMPLVKYLIQTWFFHHNPDFTITNGKYFFYRSHFLYITSAGFVFPNLFAYQKVLIGLWLSIILLIVISQLYHFFIFKHRIKQYLLPLTNYDKELNSIKADLNIKKDVTLYYCDIEISPFTYGIKSANIVLTSLVTNESKNMILRHELQHIKSHDFIFRIFALFVVLLHCFNPISYLFLKDLKEIQEMNCDEKLVTKFTHEERMKYGHILISISSKAKALTAPALYFSQNNKTFLTKRIKKIAITNFNKTSHIIIATVILCIFSAIPVFAYSPESIDWRNSSTQIQHNIEESTWIELDVDSSIDSETSLSFPQDEKTFSICKQYVLLSNGTIIPLKDTSIEPFSTCKHSFKNGTFKSHIRKGKGCIVKSYSVRICTKCNAIQDKSLISSMHYTKCPHN